MSWRIGVGKADITPDVPGIGMLGYGIRDQNVQGVATPLFARAFVVQDGDARLAYCLADICFISQSVRDRVMERLDSLGLNEHQVMLSATHTHSGPGGYSHFLFYNLPVPGFCEQVLDAIAEGIAQAISSALESLTPGTVRLAQGAIPDHEPVGFNRALTSYNRNPDVAKVAASDAHVAIDRTMTLLRFDDAAGRALGAFAWFGVHGCSVHSDNTLLHHDNKGCAADAMEQWAVASLDAPGFVAAFPQTTPGDVTPNGRWCARRRLSVGPFDDDFDNARLNGEIQARQARRLWRLAASSPPLRGALAGRIRYASHEELPVDSDLVGGRAGVRTARARIGINMLQGTGEGPGPLLHLPWLTWPLQRLLRAADLVGRGLGRGPNPHGTKFPFLDTSRGGRGRAFGVFIQGDPVLPGFVDPVVARVKALKQIDGVGDKPWTNPVVPVQLFVIGRFALSALPGEPTTTAGARIRETMRGSLGALGADTMVVGGYGNAYAGYITTRQEYDQQRYEGASTYFGRYTLAGYRTRLRALAASLAAEPNGPEAPLGATPLRFTPRELALRAFVPAD